MAAEAGFADEWVSSVQSLVAAYARLQAGFRARRGLSANEGMVVMHLLDRGVLTSADLSRAVGVSTAAMVGIVKRLESARLIVRRSDPDDARRMLLYPTKRLIADQIELARPLTDALQDVAGKLAPEHCTVALELLRATCESCINITSAP